MIEESIVTISITQNESGAFDIEVEYAPCDGADDNEFTEDLNMLARELILHAEHCIEYDVLSHTEFRHLKE